MKKILTLALLLIVGGAVYTLTAKKTSAPQMDNTAEKEHEDTTSPAPTPPTAPPANPPVAPAPTPPAGEAVKDDMEDVDVPPVQTKTFNITGKNFSFSHTEIRVKKGEIVVINFESTDGFHDWVVDEFNAKTERVSTGGKTSVQFTADKTGTFEYYCSVGPHRAAGMKGNLIVE